MPHALHFLIFTAAGWLNRQSPVGLYSHPGRVGQPGPRDWPEHSEADSPQPRHGPCGRARPAHTVENVPPGALGRAGRDRSVHSRGPHAGGTETLPGPLRDRAEDALRPCGWHPPAAEVSHQPTRQRERQMRRFKSAAHLQRFASVHGVVQNLFRVGRHLLRAVHHRLLRARAFAEWDTMTCAC